LIYLEIPGMFFAIQPVLFCSMFPSLFCDVSSPCPSFFLPPFTLPSQPLYPLTGEPVCLILCREVKDCSLPGSRQSEVRSSLVYPTFGGRFTFFLDCSSIFKVELPAPKVGEGTSFFRLFPRTGLPLWRTGHLSVRFFSFSHQKSSSFRPVWARRGSLSSF